MAKYKVKQGDWLSTIARKFGLPSWKYLYELNKDVIGDNPDLIKVGIELTIPQWDSTSGDEKLASKGADVHEFTGGLRYAYPWVPYSATMVTKKGEVYTEKRGGESSETFEKAKEFKVKSSRGGDVLLSGSLTDAKGIEGLVADAPSKEVEIDSERYGKPTMDDVGEEASALGGEASGVCLLYPRPLSCVIDSHMHIQSGHCTPLPLVWDNLNLGKWHPTQGMKRSRMDSITSSFAVELFLKGGGTLQTLPSKEVAQRAVQDNNGTYGPYSAIAGQYPYAAPSATAPADKTSTAGEGTPEDGDSGLFCPMIALTMDMEHGHIAGYNGQTIYHYDSLPWYYYRRSSGLREEYQGEKVELDREERWLFTKWNVQVQQTREAAARFPWQVLPLYHYEPRRWRKESGASVGAGLVDGPWDAPFSEIAVSGGRGGVFAGFKMYTALGYRPQDPRLPQLDNFYARCQKEKIPIVVHSSPKGLLTHEVEFYLEYDQGGGGSGGSQNPTAQQSTTYIKSGIDSAEHFRNNYIHPRAWRDVLKRNPNLRLCLAHFGSDEWEKGIESDWIDETIRLMRTYPGVYTDVSCFNSQKNRREFIKFLQGGYEDVFDRILFGTDWYMTMLVMNGKTYQSYCDEMKRLLDSVDRDLWARFSLVNPFSFYGFDDTSRLAALRTGLERAGADPALTARGYERMLIAGEDVRRLSRKA